MTRNPTTTFRFDERFLEGLENLATSHGVSRAEVVRYAVAGLAWLYEEARRDNLANLGVLRARYGDDAWLIVSVSASADGSPEARLVIDGAGPDDARAFPVLGADGTTVDIFLDVTHEDRQPPLLLPLGGEPLLIPRAQLPIGTLSWPPDQTGITLRLGDVDSIINPPPSDTPQRLPSLTAA
jgi:hypothetical protein